MACDLKADGGCGSAAFATGQSQSGRERAYLSKASCQFSIQQKKVSSLNSNARLVYYVLPVTFDGFRSSPNHIQVYGSVQGLVQGNPTRKSLQSSSAAGKYLFKHLQDCINNFGGAWSSIIVHSLAHSL